MGLYRSPAERAFFNVDWFDAKLEQRLAETRAELIKWMFLFWLGTVAATLAGIFTR